MGLVLTFRSTRVLNLALADRLGRELRLVDLWADGSTPLGLASLSRWRWRVGAVSRVTW